MTKYDKKTIIFEIKIGKVGQKSREKFLILKSVSKERGRARTRDTMSFDKEYKLFDCV